MIGLSILFPCMPLQWECKGHPLFDDYLDECRREKAGNDHLTARMPRSGVKNEGSMIPCVQAWPWG